MSDKYIAIIKYDYSSGISTGRYSGISYDVLEFNSSKEILDFLENENHKEAKLLLSTTISMITPRGVTLHSLIKGSKIDFKYNHILKKELKEVITENRLELVIKE